MNPQTEEFAQATPGYYAWTRRVFDASNGETLFTMTCRLPRREFFKLLFTGKRIEIPDIERMQDSVLERLQSLAKEKGLEILGSGDPARFSKEHVEEVTADEMNV